jgi:hypothetical protein
MAKCGSDVGVFGGQSWLQSTPSGHLAPPKFACAPKPGRLSHLAMASYHEHLPL